MTDSRETHVSFVAFSFYSVTRYRKQLLYNIIHFRMNDIYNPDKYLNFRTLIPSFVGGAVADNPTYKMRTSFLMPLALSALCQFSTKNLIGLKLWNISNFASKETWFLFFHRKSSIFSLVKWHSWERNVM